jgi:glycine/sarcosine N-methyltransferase
MPRIWCGMDTSFYQQLAADYDRVIPWEKRLKSERPWFEALWQRFGVRRVLDASCGTGRHLVLFAQMGLEVSGADASPEMVALARQNVAESGFDFADRIYAVHWSRLSEEVPGTFGAVLCVGNSLPYVTDLDELRRSLAGLWSKVAPDGILLVQFKNFPRLQLARQRFLPISSSSPPDETIALRMYDYHPDKIDFNVILLRREPNGGWGMRHQVTPLRPYRADEIRSELTQLGASTDLYGSLSLQEFDPDSSEDVVLVCRRA